MDDWDLTALSYGIKPWEVDESIALRHAMDDFDQHQMNSLEPEELKQDYPEEYFDRYVVPKLRTKELDMNDDFDALLSQRRNALLNSTFDIIDFGIIKIKRPNFANSEDNEGESILHKKAMNKHKQTTPSLANSTKLVHNHNTPSLGSEFVSDYPLKCKWIDGENHVHFEYFKLRTIDDIIRRVSDLNDCNRPQCDNWCVQYRYDETATDNIGCKSKSLNYDLFWSCSLYFTMFGTTGVQKYDDDLNQLTQVAIFVFLPVLNLEIFCTDLGFFLYLTNDRPF
eukprot:155168_1